MVSVSASIRRREGMAQIETIDTDMPALAEILPQYDIDQYNST
jgi:hypothetical protein